jgi:hypothetical protein
MNLDVGSSCDSCGKMAMEIAVMSQGSIAVKESVR